MQNLHAWFQFREEFHAVFVLREGVQGAVAQVLCCCCLCTVMCIERAGGPVKSKEINILTLLSARPVERNVNDLSI